MILEITESKEISLYFDESVFSYGSVFFYFLNVGFSFATLQAFGKTPQEIERLQSVETDFAKI